MKKIIVFLISFLGFTQANASVIYDEAVDGDAALWWYDGGASLGTVQNGDVVLGSTGYFGYSDWDGYLFNLDGTIETITVEAVSGTFGQNYWQLYQGNSALVWGGDLTFVGDTITFDVLGYTGIYSIGNNSMGGGTDYSYSVTFSSVPAPASIALLAFGLVALGFRVKRRA